MQRYFVENEQINDNFVTITGDDVRHISKVMRMESGDQFICCNQNGDSAVCEIEEITTTHIGANVVEWIKELKELPVNVTIAQGLPKGDKLELVVQKGTELGAASFQAFSAARSIVKWDSAKGKKKTERLQKIAKEAAEQSHRTIIPTVKEPLSFNRLLESSRDFDLKIVAYEEAAKAGESSNLASALSKVKHGESIFVVFGPEGGLTEAEVEELASNGFIPCSLGPRILRAETAPLYFLSAVSYHTELLG
jgi:16S rRNA (uracil1498-N3)-methyltransferase